MSDARRISQSDLARLRLANIRSFAATCQPEISQLQSSAVKRFSGIGPSKAHLEWPPTLEFQPKHPIAQIIEKVPAFAGMDDDDSEAW